MKKKVITIKGTHCASCKAVIEDVSKDIEGVVSCTVDFNTGKTEIEYDDRLNWEKLKQEIETLEQYKVQLPAL